MRLFQILAAVLAFYFVSLPSWAEDFSKLEAFLDESVEKDVVVGGVVLVYHRGEVVFKEAFGYADREAKRPFEVDTPVIVASISKPIVRTTLHRLMDLGHLDLQKPVTEFLPEFLNAKLESGENLTRFPTVSEMLTHRSGLRAYDDTRGRIWYLSWTKNLTLEAVILDVADKCPFKAQPNTRFAYSGIGTDVAARVGEVVSKLSRNEMLQVYFSKPLGLKNTYFRSDKRRHEENPHMPKRYYRNKDSGKLTLARLKELPAVDRYSSSGGTVISTADDLLTWLLMIRNGGVHQGIKYLSDSVHQQMMKKHPKSNIAGGGLFVREKDKKGVPFRYGHTGSSGTNVWIDLKTVTIGIMLTQAKGKDIIKFRNELVLLCRFKKVNHISRDFAYHETTS